MPVGITENTSLTISQSQHGSDLSKLYASHIVNIILLGNLLERLDVYGLIILWPFYVLDLVVTLALILIKNFFSQDEIIAERATPPM